MTRIDPKNIYYFLLSNKIRRSSSQHTTDHIRIPPHERWNIWQGHAAWPKMWKLHHTDRFSPWLQSRAQLPYIQLHNEPEARRDWWAVIAAHKATRHLPTQAVYGTWLVCRGQKAEVMDEMRWAWKVAGSALPLGWATWLWLKNCPFLYLLYICSSEFLYDTYVTWQ